MLPTKAKNCNLCSFDIVPIELEKKPPLNLEARGLFIGFWHGRGLFNSPLPDLKLLYTHSIYASIYEDHNKTTMHYDIDLKQQWNMIGLSTCCSVYLFAMTVFGC